MNKITSLKNIKTINKTYLGYGLIVVWFIVLNISFSDNPASVSSNVIASVVMGLGFIAGLLPWLVFWRERKEKRTRANLIGFILSFIPLFFSVLILLVFFIFFSNR